MSSWSVSVFGVGQMAYAVTYSSYLYVKAWSRPDWRTIGLPPTSLTVFLKQLDFGTCYTAFVYTIQGFFKHLLTEADKILLSTMADSYNQGVYAMGAAYGGIAARILLQPLEENARLLWSRLSLDVTQNKKGQQQLLESYTILVKLVMYVGFVFSCIAVNYTSLLLSILAGQKWGSNSEASDVLSGFCFYTAFLALNGMTEAFVYAVNGGASAAVEMTKLGFVHTCVGITFSVSASILVRLYGTHGIVAANCIAMLTRSLYSLYFASKYFRAIGATQISSSKTDDRRKSLMFAICPHPVILIAFIAAYKGTKASLNILVEKDHHLKINIRDTDWLFNTVLHVSIGILFVMVIASLIAFFEKSFTISLSQMLLRRKEEKSKPD